jgi:hypothetical protein
LGELKGPVRQVCGDEIADKCKQIWGLNEEGEINGCWRDLGFPGLWYMMGMYLIFCASEELGVELSCKATWGYAVSIRNTSRYVSPRQSFLMENESLP